MAKRRPKIGRKRKKEGEIVREKQEEETKKVSVRLKKGHPIIRRVLCFNWQFGNKMGVKVEH